MPVRPMLLHGMALVSFRLICKNLGNLQEFFGQIVYRPLAENCPYAYVLSPQSPRVLPLTTSARHCLGAWNRLKNK